MSLEVATNLMLQLAKHSWALGLAGVSPGRRGRQGGGDARVVAQHQGSLCGTCSPWG